ncbi:hypothetical protein Tco_0524168 [Tanacetum coccineum]
MTTTNQGISVEEIEQIVAQRVANAIEAIAIYETTTSLARMAMSQTKRQGEKCAPKCTNCKKVGHLTKDCWRPINNNRRTITCYECGNQGHYRSDCPVLRNQGTEARGMVYTLGEGETDQDINSMEDDINV